LEFIPLKKNLKTATLQALLISSLLLSGLSSCSHFNGRDEQQEQEKDRAQAAKLAGWKKSGIIDSPAFPLALAGPLSNKRAEVSGLTWYKEQVMILMPQFLKAPGQVNKAALYALSLNQLKTSLSQQGLDPLIPQEIPVLHSEWLSKDIEGYEGFEAIAFRGDDGYLTVEAKHPTKGMQAYLIHGKMKKGKSGELSFVLDPSSLTSIPIMSHLKNFACESIVLTDHSILAIFEANGKKVNPASGAVAFEFDFNLKYLGTVPFPALDFRVTDASAMNAQGEFFVLNYFWTGDREVLKEQNETENKELIIPLVYNKTKKAIERSSALAINIKNPRLKKLGHNWEGIAALDKIGFFVITDEHPETILGFVGLPAPEKAE
jgi:hypothetical protein